MQNLKSADIKAIFAEAKLRRVLIITADRGDAKQLNIDIIGYAKRRYPELVTRAVTPDTIYLKGHEGITITWLDKWRSMRRLNKFDGAVIVTDYNAYDVPYVSREPVFLFDFLGGAKT